MKGLRDMIRAEVRKVIAEEIGKAIREEFGALGATEDHRGPLPEEGARVPVGTFVRVNQTSRGPTGVGAASQVARAWTCIQSHLGEAVENRTVLAREVETLMEWPKPTASALISKLIKDGCLIVVQRKVSDG